MARMVVADEPVDARLAAGKTELAEAARHAWLGD